MDKNSGNKVGIVNVANHNSSCQRCKKTSKELVTLKKVEEALLDNAHNPKLHSIIANPHHTKTKDEPRTLLTEDLNIKETRPKVISKLANLTKHHDSKYSDIDQPLDSTQGTKRKHMIPIIHHHMLMRSQ